MLQLAEAGRLNSVEAVLYRLRALLRTSWRATIVITVVVAITGGLALTLIAGATRTVTAPDRYVSSQGDQFEVMVQQTDGAPRTAELEALHSVAKVDAATFVFGGLRAPGSSEPEDALVFAGSLQPLKVRLVDGHLPDPRQPGQFVANRGFLDKGRRRIGDHFRLVTFTREQSRDEGFDAKTPKGPTLQATLVGVVEGPSQLEDDSVSTLFPSALIRGRDVGVSATLFAVGLKSGADIGDFRAEIAELADGSSFDVQPAVPISAEIRSAVNAQGNALVILATIVAVAAMIVVGQLLSRQYRLSDSEKRILGTLGFTGRQLDSEPVIRAAVGVVAGSVGAGLIAYLCSGLFPRGFVTVVEPHPGLRFDALAHVVGPVILSFVLLSWVLGAAVARRRSHGEATSAALTAEWFVRMIPSPSAAIGLRFAATRPSGLGRPARLPFVGLALLAGLVFGAIAFGADLAHLVETPRLYGQNFDIGVGAGGAVTRKTIAPLSGHSKVASLVDSITLYGSSTASTASASFNLVGMDPVRGHQVPDVLDGRLPAKPDEIALGQKTARRLHAEVGEPLRLRVGRSPKSFQVTGTVLPPPVGGSDLIGDAGVVTAEGYSVLAPGQPMNTATIKLSTDPPADAVSRIGRALGVEVGANSEPSAIVNLRRVRGIPFVVAGIVGVLATLSLMHQMFTAVRRRKVDLAILRALGASRRMVAGVVQWQASIVTVVVLAIGIPLGIATGNLLYRSFIGRTGARTDIRTPPGWIFLVAVALLALANLATAVPAWRARRLSPTEALTER